MMTKRLVEWMSRSIEGLDLIDGVELGGDTIIGSSWYR
jgi:hypothetical protein